MDKRSFRWLIPIALFAVFASQFAARSDWRALLSLDYWKSLSRYGMVMRIVESEFVHADEVNFEDLTDVALREAVRSLDPYSDYMTPEDYEMFSMAANQEYVGVGIEVGQFSGRVIISQVFEQGSAAAAGVLPGDFIVGVDGHDTRAHTLAEVVERIRGEPGSLVSLEIERPMSAQTHTFELVRRAIALDSVVQVAMQTALVGYFKVRQFIDDTDLEMLSAIHALKAQGMRGLIIDLRGNPGGRLDTAAKMAQVFLEPGQQVLTVQSRRGVEEVYEAEASADAFRQPLIVLIDGNSASASEILAGALRDHARAILVGEQSYGKGSVQSVYGFRDGDGLKLTSARYLLPSGEAINGTGVSPDVHVEMQPEDAILLMLQKHHLRAMSAAAFSRAFGFAPIDDAPLQVAAQMLDAVIQAQRARSTSGR
jgi:carboxyl-terminal processing protease